jgi:hypothetical protein
MVTMIRFLVSGYLRLLPPADDIGTWIIFLEAMDQANYGRLRKRISLT